MPQRSQTPVPKIPPNPSAGFSRSTASSSALGARRKPLCRPPASSAAPAQASSTGRMIGASRQHDLQENRGDRLRPHDHHRKR